MILYIFRTAFCPVVSELYMYHDFVETEQYEEIEMNFYHYKQIALVILQW